MTSAGTITVDVTGRDVNLVALLTRLDAQMRQTDQAGLKLSQTTGGTFTAAQQKAANAALQEAQALARAAVAVGDDARAHQILTTALGNSAAAGDRQVASLTAQIGRLQNGATVAEQFGSAISSGLLGIVGPAAAAGAALQALREIPALVQLGAQAEQTRIRFEQLAQTAGTTGPAFTAALRQASGGTIADTNLQLAAMRANLLGVGSSAAQLGPLLAIARDRAQQMGISTADAFDSLVTGLGRGSKLILDNIGVIVKEGEVNEAYAKSVGKTVAQLTDQEKKQALINEVMRQGQATIAATGGAVETNATKLERLGALGENIKAGLGARLADAILPTADAVTSLTGAFDGTRESMLRYADAVAVWSGQNAQGVETNRALIATILDVANVGSVGSAAASQAANAAAQQAVAQIQAATASAFGAQAAEQNAQAQAHLASEHAAGGSAAAIYAQQAQAAADASLNDSLAKQADALQTQILNQETQNMANAFLAANPHIDAAGIKAAVMAGALTPAQAAVVELTLKIQGLRGELAAISGGKVGGGGPGLSASSFATSQQFFNKNQREAAAAAAAAQREQTLATGSTAEKMALLNRELADAKRLYGEGSAQAIRAQTAIDVAIDKSTKKTRGAGAARISDQQRLNNQLLSNQERFSQQSEQAEAEHGKRLVEIERDFQERSLAQQRENEVSKRQSRADFYDSLTSATKEVGGQVAQSLSAAYEAAYAQAQSIAQSGNAKLAADYLALKQKQIQADLDFQKQLAAAQKDGNKDEVARLQAIHQLRQDAAAQEERQLIEGGDANVKQRDEALADEQRKFEEQQGKIGTSAENAAERKINAALRSGKAIDDENIKLQQQEQIINRIGAKGGNAPVAGGGLPTPTGPAAPTIPNAAPTDLTALAGQLQAIVDAVNAAQAGITKAQGETTAAVRSVAGRAVGA